MMMKLNKPLASQFSYTIWGIYQIKELCGIRNAIMTKMHFGVTYLKRNKIAFRLVFILFFYVFTKNVNVHS